ncbi:hypothetical protein [Caulobacter sp. BP25]|uniref:hypothetical protein n=1 Tax=Caulobacter sp. BP25 TaxID=2048900 RepID=UPI000C129E08|nr:hypothetical protein [Caulobacter sp. BP25]PHY19369.1 hypothetical protein CSW59_13385 [Caulobacter sp. BP25]
MRLVHITNMSITLRAFMAARRAEIQSQIKALKEELREIDVAFAALPQEGQPKQARERGSSGTGKKTLKEMAIEAIVASPDGLEAADVIRWINEKYGLNVARESMSPQLSRLGQDGTLMRIGLVWKTGPRLAFGDGPPAPPFSPESITAPPSEEEEAV